MKNDLWKTITNLLEDNGNTPLARIPSGIFSTIAMDLRNEGRFLALIKFFKSSDSKLFAFVENHDLTNHKLQFLGYKFKSVESHYSKKILVESKSNALSPTEEMELESRARAFPTSPTASPEAVGAELEIIRSVEEEMFEQISILAGNQVLQLNYRGLYYKEDSHLFINYFFLSMNGTRANISVETDATKKIFAISLDIAIPQRNSFYMPLYYSHRKKTNPFAVPMEEVDLLQKYLRRQLASMESFIQEIVPQILNREIEYHDPRDL